MVWGGAVPDRCGGPELLLAGGDGSRWTAKCGSHRSVGVGQVLRAARGLYGGGVGAATTIWHRWFCPGATLTLGIGRGVDARLRGRVLAAAQIGGAEPATVRHHNVRRGTPDLGPAIRDVAWCFANRQLAGAHRGVGAPGNPGSWTSGGAVLRFYQTEPVTGLVGGMQGVLAVE